MTEPRVDTAAETMGRVAGTTVNALGMRLLRLRMVRQALARAGQEVRKEEQSPPPMAREVGPAGTGPEGAD